MNRPTESDNLQRLTTRQECVIDLLIAGKAESFIARSLGIHRTTIARWRAYHPAFQAELARRRAELFGFATDWIRSLVPKALEVLEISLEGESKLQVAQVILRMAGLDRVAPPPSDPDDAEELILKLVQQRCDEVKADRDRHRTDMERLMAMATPPSREDEIRLMTESVENVTAELRRKLADDQSIGGSK